MEQSLKAVTPFEVGKARLDGTIVKTFFRMELGITAKDERMKITLLKSKMADTNVTTEWYNGIVDSEVIPTTIAEWKIMIEEYFDVANLITRARSDFKNIEMKQSEKVSTFVDRFKTARLKADIRDDKDSAERLVDGLNEFWTTVLLSDPEYKNLRKKSKYGSEDISKYFASSNSIKIK